MSFNIGDRVQWSSQAAGQELSKIGEVVAIVPKETSPKGHDAVKLGCNVYDLAEKLGAASQFGGGFSRQHQSYLVLVSYPNTKRKPKLYWPIVKRLRAATALDVA